MQMTRCHIAIVLTRLSGIYHVNTSLLYLDCILPGQEFLNFYKQSVGTSEDVASFVALDNDANPDSTIVPLTSMV